MKILLLSLPFEETEFYIKGYFSKTKQAPLFPFGIAYIAQYLQENGHDVEILDIYANQLDKDVVLDKIKSMSFDIVGISALVTQYAYLKWIVPEIKNIKDVPIILGNGLATSCYQLVLNKLPQVEACVIGEGEIAMLEILNNGVTKASGVAYRVNDGIAVNPSKRMYIDELTPAYDKLDMTPYLNAKMYETGLLDIRTKYADKRILPMLTSRGCPYNCGFCGKVIEHARLRPVGSIVKEIRYLQDKYNIQGVHFIDELFAVNKARAIELSRALKPLKLIWDCQARVNTIDRETLKVMQDAGCVAIGFGVESGSQKILDSMNKKTTVKQIEDAMTATMSIHMPVKVQLIFGYTGENYETIQETVDLFKRIGHPGRFMSAIVPLPGTQLWEYARSKGLVEDNEEWLVKLAKGFERNNAPVDFTEFGVWLESLSVLKRKYDKMMEDNYKQYLWSHPSRLITDLIYYPSLRVAMLSDFLGKMKLLNLTRYIYRSIKNQYAKF